MTMYWVGKNNDGRVGRSKASTPICETRWIVPVRPYQAPKGSWEQIENTILMGVGIVVVVASLIFIGMAGAV